MTPTDVFATLQVYLGSPYVNDFNYLGRTYQVTAQADGAVPRRLRDIARPEDPQRRAARWCRSARSRSFRDMTGPYRVPRYNLYPAAEVRASPRPASSTGYGAAPRWSSSPTRCCRDGIGFEWTELAFQQKQAGNTGAARLRRRRSSSSSWCSPRSTRAGSCRWRSILIVPMCLLAAVTGLLLRGMTIDILAQIGFVVLVGLAAKNAILIVEFARQARGRRATTGARPRCDAARTRLRPILMTSFAFILGVVPLAVATGAGAEMRQSLGTAVFFGMLGVTAVRPALHAGVLRRDPRDLWRAAPRAGARPRHSGQGRRVAHNQHTRLPLPRKGPNHLAKRPTCRHPGEKPDKSAHGWTSKPQHFRRVRAHDQRRYRSRHLITTASSGTHCFGDGTARA